jgi:hypothetical protein
MGPKAKAKAAGAVPDAIGVPEEETLMVLTGKIDTLLTKLDRIEETVTTAFGETEGGLVSKIDKIVAGHFGTYMRDVASRIDKAVTLAVEETENGVVGRLEHMKNDASNIEKAVVFAIGGTENGLVSKLDQIVSGHFVKHTKNDVSKVFSIIV